VHFAPLDGNEFGVLIQHVFYNCKGCVLSNGYLIISPINYLIDLNDVPLDLVLKKNTKENMVNVWEDFEAFPLLMVFRGMDTSSYRNIQITTTRPYNFVKKKIRTTPSKIKFSSTSIKTINENALYAKIDTKYS